MRETGVQNEADVIYSLAASKTKIPGPKLYTWHGGAYLLRRDDIVNGKRHVLLGRQTCPDVSRGQSRSSRKRAGNIQYLKAQNALPPNSEL